MHSPLTTRRLISRELSFLWSRGHLSFPQTTPATLMRRLARSAQREWKTILAKEVLLRLKRAYQAGHPEAPDDARLWCEKHRLLAPDWVLQAPRHPNRQGRPSEAVRFIRFNNDLARFKLVESLKSKRAYIKSSVAYDKWRPREERWASELRAGDPYEWAKFMVRGSPFLDTPSEFSAKGISKAYYKFKNRRESYYLSPRSLMTFLEFDAPTIHKLLLR